MAGKYLENVKCIPHISPQQYFQMPACSLLEESQDGGTDKNLDKEEKLRLFYLCQYRQLLTNL